MKKVIIFIVVFLIVASNFICIFGFYKEEFFIGRAVLGQIIRF